MKIFVEKHGSVVDDYYYYGLIHCSGRELMAVDTMRCYQSIIRLRGPAPVSRTPTNHPR